MWETWAGCEFPQADFGSATLSTTLPDLATLGLSLSLGNSLTNKNAVGEDSETGEESGGIEISVPVFPQELHHLLFLIQLKEKRQALLAFSFAQMLHEFVNVRMAKFRARIQVGRAS
jgi:hypothetical protein